VGIFHSTKIKFNLMNLRLLNKQLGRTNMCITKENEKKNFKHLGEIRKRKRKIMGRRDLNLL
jgi:hypothetical protein